MPTIPSMNIPTPKNWQDFETIVRDAQALRWKSTGLQKHGRPGQKQYGVDIVGPDEIGRLVGIQCKRYKTPLQMKDVTDEVAKAEKFKDSLSALFMATTADHDAKLQGEVRELSAKRVAAGSFAVALLYWDEIIASLLLNPKVFKVHYPQFSLPTSDTVAKERLIAALELGYYGADIWEFIVLILGEFGVMVQEDPDQVPAILRIIEHRAQQLLPPDDAAVISESLVEMRKLFATPKKSDSDWDPIELLSDRISSRNKGGSSLLPLVESNVLDLGVQLGRIFHNADSLPPQSVRKDIEVKIRNIIKGPTTKSSIRGRLLKANSATSGYSWANQIYALLDHEIRFGGV
jgi:hypothetical protein